MARRDSLPTDLLLLAALVIWSEVRETRQLAAISAAVATEDPFTVDSLKKRIVDQGLNTLIAAVLL